MYLENSNTKFKLFSNANSIPELKNCTKRILYKLPCKNDIIRSNLNSTSVY